MSLLDSDNFGKVCTRYEGNVGWGGGGSLRGNVRGCVTRPVYGCTMAPSSVSTNHTLFLSVDRWVILMNVGINFIRGWVWGALNANVHHCVRLAIVMRSVSVIHLQFVIVWLDSYGL